MLESLTPTSIEKGTPGYTSVKELEEILTNVVEKDKKIRNIALMGPYGSGKSSVLYTLQREIEEKNGNGDHSAKLKFLSISLATLRNNRNSDLYENEENSSTSSEDENFNEESINDKDNINKKIEFSILQQLIYRESSETVRNSRIKRIQPPIKKLNPWTIIFSIIAIIALVVLFEPLWLRVDTFYEWLDFKEYNIIGDLLALGYLFWFSYKYLIPNLHVIISKIKRVNFNGTELELGNEGSILNKYQDEILNFFSHTPYNVVLIEDIDRFNNPDIFLKLRELSFIINESDIVKRHVVFIYAVKEDIFHNEDRTKFFDYIVTVIPYINSSNSKDILKKKLKAQAGIETEIDDESLTDMAFYIEDMRLLTNIVNEFCQYRTMLKNSNLSHGLDLTKLLGIIVYKNYYPEDFAKLQRRKGKLFSIINMKNKFENHLFDEYKEEKESLNNIIKHIESETTNSINDLRLNFLRLLIKKINKEIIAFDINDVYYSINEIIESDDLFNKLLKSSNHTWYFYYNRHNNNRHIENTSCRDFQKLINETKKEYDIDLKIKSVNKEFQNKISGKKKEISEKEKNIRAKSISFYLKNYPQIYSLIEISDLDDNEMILRFLREGYIDENYYDYISFFYEGMLSYDDKSWVRLVKSGRDANFNYQIQNIKNVISELKISDFTSDSILNVSLLDYLIETSHERYINVLTRIKNSQVKLDFLENYYNDGKYIDKIFQELFNEESEVYWNLISTDEISERQNLFRILWYKYVNNLTESSILWIEDKLPFINNNIEKIGRNKVKTIIAESKFKKIEEVSLEILNEIINNKSFIITYENLNSIHKQIMRNNTQSISISSILNSGKPDLIQYLTEENQINQTLEILSGKTQEEENGLIFILNNKTISKELKTNYTKDQNKKISSINAIKQDFWGILLINNIIEANWENINKYFLENGLTSELINFIENNYLPLSNYRFEILSETEKLSQTIFLSNKLSMNAYNKLVPKINGILNEAALLPSLESKRLETLLKNKKLSYHQETLIGLSDTNNLGIYAENFKRHFLSIFKELTLNYTIGTCKRILYNSVFTESEKLAFYHHIPMATIIADSVLQDYGVGILIERPDDLKFNITDIRALLYPGMNPIKQNKIRYLIMQREPDLIPEILNEMGEPYNRIVQGGNPHLEINEFNNTLLSFLKEQGVVSSFPIKKGVYKVYPHKNQ